MPLSSPSEPALPAAWNQVLEQIQQVLSDALRATEERAQALDAPISADAGSRPDLDIVLQSLVFPTEKTAIGHEAIAEAEQALIAAQEAVERWLASAAQVRQKLAEQAARAV